MLLYFSFIGKTETANNDMGYIAQEKLSGYGGPLQLRYDNTDLQKQKMTTNGDIDLPLFNMLKDPEKTIKELMSRYQLDMSLFGYSYKMNEGKVVGFCNSYDKYNFCC